MLLTILVNVYYVRCFKWVVLVNLHFHFRRWKAVDVQQIGKLRLREVRLFPKVMWLYEFGALCLSMYHNVIGPLL